MMREPMSSAREGELSKYREQIKRALAERGDPSLDSYHIALADLVPGIAFREIWPLASVNSPLRPYFRDRVANRDYIPRKSEKPTALWLTRALAAFGEVDRPTSLNLAYIGDSASDVALARNISRCSDAAIDFDVHVTLYLYEPGNVGEEMVSPTFRFIRLPTWTAIEDACRAQLAKPERDCDNFLLLDIDRTVLLPRGLCDAAFGRVGATAVERFVNWFATGSPSSAKEIANAFAAAREFPSYSVAASTHYGDEDVRAIACLLLCANLLAVDDFSRRPPGFQHWLPPSLNALDKTRWNHERVARLVESLQISLHFKDCTLAPYFREMEHNVMLEMIDQAECRLNGHLVRLISEALSRDWAPVAYSDRPGSSVGLALRSYYRSWPILSQRSLIQAELPVAFERAA